ncbi:MAG: pyridoxamine 5'-phosphate oxidase family protein [Proteobacteria bacterium]|nr:pyridoxamine 5'-phosphate oxidase family protein [Pseudomonadota bacterium]
MNKSEILKFLDAQAIVILTTMNHPSPDGLRVAGGTQPETRALINIRNATIAPHLTAYFKKHDRILLITNTHTDKIKQIRKNPTAALYTFDDKWSGMLLTGRAIEITDAETINALWDDSWKMYYPDGRDGGDFSVIEFVPENFKSYSGANFEKKSGRVE